MAERLTEMIPLHKENSVSTQQDEEKEEKKDEMKAEEKTGKKSSQCVDRHVSRQMTLIDRQITQTYDNVIWIEEHKIFEMLERKTSHADPELSCIFTYWKKRFRQYGARLWDKRSRKSSKYIDITCIKKWGEELKARADTKEKEEQEFKVLLEFLASFESKDLRIWEDRQLVIPSDKSMNDDDKHKLVFKKHFCKTFQQFVEANCESGETTDNVKTNPGLCCTNIQQTISINDAEAEVQEVTNLDAMNETDNFMPKTTKDGNILPDQNNQITHNKKLVDLKQVLLMFAYAEEFRWWPPKPFSTIMFLVHLSIFIHLYVSTASSSYNNKDPIPECSVLILNPYKPYQAWRYFSYSLVHFDIVHLITNLVGIFIAGVFLEYTNKWWRIAPVFYAGVIFAGIILTSISPQPLIGMSAGVYALMAGSIPDIVLNWKDIKLLLRQKFTDRKITQALPTRSIPSKSHKYFKCRQIRLAIPILWMVLDMGYSTYSVLGRCQLEFCGTSYGAHMIGTLTGLVGGFLWLKNRRFKTWVIVMKRVLRYVLFAIIIAFLIALIAKISESRDLALGQGRGSNCRSWREGKCCEHKLDTGVGPCCLHYLYNQTANSN